MAQQSNDPPSCMRPTEPDRPFLLASDIDGTLLGDEEGMTALKTFAGHYPGAFHLALVTGRSLSSVVGLVELGYLPRPNYVCGSVGSEIVDYHDPHNVIGRKYTGRVSPTWDLEAIYMLGEGEGIHRQDFPNGRPRFQAGFYWDGREETLAAFRERLNGWVGCRILPSYGQFIDVFPDLVGKGHAVRFLRRELGLDVDRVVVAGDSGNDREMFETNFKGIVPANGLDELKAIACQSRHYQSPFPAALGVLDGLRHFGFIEDTSESGQCP
ncbi:MAG: HAD hydrolase family protein [Anaerolineae bacterium]|nr:HAD hydrolase family protein [Anaerolineae bacterium]